MLHMWRCYNKLFHYPLFKICSVIKFGQVSLSGLWQLMKKQKLTKSINYILKFNFHKFDIMLLRYLTALTYPCIFTFIHFYVHQDVIKSLINVHFLPLFTIQNAFNFIYSFIQSFWLSFIQHLHVLESGNAAVIHA